MSAYDDTIDILVAAGVSEERAKALLTGVIREKKSQSKNALKCRAYRQRMVSRPRPERVATPSPVSPTPHLIKNNNLRSVATPLPPTPPKNLKKEKKEEDSLRGSPAVGQERYGYVSFDETVNFTADEIAKLSMDCYSLTNVSGQVRNLAESKWMTTMKPLERKKAIINKIKKNHTARIETKQPAPQEQKQALLEKAWEHQRITDAKNAKADEVRRRLGYG